MPNIACRQLGFPRGGREYYIEAGNAPPGSDYLAADVACHEGPLGGDQATLAECDPVRLSSVPDSCDAGQESDRYLQRIICQGAPSAVAGGCRLAGGGNPSSGSWLLPFTCMLQPLAGAVKVEDVRVAGGEGRGEGRLEVRVDGQWGTVCSDPGPDGMAALAAVACRQLSLGGPALYRGAAFYGDDGLCGPLLDVKSCSGDEERLDDCNVAIAGDALSCKAPAFGVACEGEHAACSTWMSVAATCRAPFCSCPSSSRPRTPHSDTAGSQAVAGARLTGGPSDHEGQLEVLLGDGRPWQTVCASSYAEDNAAVARVACEQLGFEGGAPRLGPLFTAEVLTPALANVRCTGEEVELARCSFAAPLPGSNDCEKILNVACAGAWCLEGGPARCPAFLPGLPACSCPSLS